VVAVIQLSLLVVVWSRVDLATPASLGFFFAFLVQVHWALKIFLTRFNEAHPTVGHAIDFSERRTLVHVGWLRAYRAFFTTTPFVPVVVVVAA
jgi:hypothetical protein